MQSSEEKQQQQKMSTQLSYDDERLYALNLMIFIENKVYFTRISINHIFNNMPFFIFCLFLNKYTYQRKKKVAEDNKLL